jgi:hypothetical protein
MGIPEDALPLNKSGPEPKEKESFFNYIWHQITARGKEEYPFVSVKRKVSGIFWVTIVFYFVWILCAGAMIGVSLSIASDPGTGLYRRLFCIGLFVIGSGFLLIFMPRSPLHGLQ